MDRIEILGNGYFFSARVDCPTFIVGGGTTASTGDPVSKVKITIGENGSCVPGDGQEPVVRNVIIHRITQYIIVTSLAIIPMIQDIRQVSPAEPVWREPPTPGSESRY